MNTIGTKDIERNGHKACFREAFIYGLRSIMMCSGHHHNKSLHKVKMGLQEGRWGKFMQVFQGADHDHSADE